MIPIGQAQIQSDGIKRLLARARRINALDAALGEALSRLGASPAAARALNLRDGGKLVIAAKSAAQAARIRQILPSLTEAMRESGVCAIVVKTPR